VWVCGCVGVWVCGCVCWVASIPYSLTSLIHSASLRSFTPFASPVNSDGCATLFFCYRVVIVWLSCGYRVVGGGTPVGL